MSGIQPFQGKAVNPDGSVTIAFQVWLQKVRKADEDRDAAQDEIIAALAEQVAAIEAANAAAAAANAAAEIATTAAADANEAIAELESGNFDLEAVTIGGQRFINDGGTLVVEP